jgi:hypothetical protein
MNGVKDLQAPVRRLTPDDQAYQYFFGYYDLPAFSGDGRYHLCNRVHFRDRLPVAGDINQLGLIDLIRESAEFIPLGETKAWNFQQGSMLQWYPEGSSDQVLYNTWDETGYGAAICQIKSGQTRRVDRPLAAVSPDGRYGLSINFNRVWNFRPGYGYCNEKDRWFDDPQPAEDGVFLVDLTGDESRLILDYQRLGALFNLDPALRAHKIVVNHITFNRTSDRFLFLVRYFPSAGQTGWKTGLGTADLDGNVYLLRSYTYASHYHWRDGKTLLIHADAGAGPALYELTDLSQGYQILNPSIFQKDIHCSYSPDRRYIVGDGYPDASGYRAIQFYDSQTDQGMVLGRFLSPAVPVTDIRCDLHVRWHPSGRMLSFDSTHEGFRGVYLLDLAHLV